MRELDLTFFQLAPMGQKSLQLLSIINNMAQELTNYLTGKRKGFDPSKPEVRLERTNDNGNFVHSNPRRGAGTTIEDCIEFNTHNHERQGWNYGWVDSDGVEHPIGFHPES